MPGDGAIIFAGLIDKLEVLYVHRGAGENESTNTLRNGARAHEQE